MGFRSSLSCDQSSSKASRNKMEEDNLTRKRKRKGRARWIITGGDIPHPSSPACMHLRWDGPGREACAHTSCVASSSAILSRSDVMSLRSPSVGALPALATALESLWRADADIASDSVFAPTPLRMPPASSLSSFAPRAAAESLRLLVEVDDPATSSSSTDDEDSPAPSRAVRGPGTTATRSRAAATSAAAPTNFLTMTGDR